VLLLLAPNGETLADSNAPTVTNTPQPTNTPVPEQPTETSEALFATATNTTIPIILTDENDSAGIIDIATPPPGSPGLSTLNRFLLMLLGVSVVVVVGVIAYIFINQARSGLDRG
jgi:hypothetical protein